MNNLSPAAALGAEADPVRDLMIDVILSRHECAVAGHIATGSRFTAGFATQWRDLLVDAAQALTKAGYERTKLRPGGQPVGVVGGCLVYPWRMPDDPSALRGFASSATRQQMFHLPAPMESMLWTGAEPAPATLDPAATVLRETVESIESLQTVLVMFKSSPRGLNFIDWAIADLDENGYLTLAGQQTIWKPEPAAEKAAADDYDSFDSGHPVGPLVQPRVKPNPHDA